MITRSTRRDVLGFGTGMLALGLAPRPGRAAGLARWLEAREEALDFGPLEPLVALMQETEPEELLPVLVARLREGTSLEELLAAGALANARTHGGQDYDGYHAFMALVPALEMARRSPADERALPVLKVLYRNTRFIRAAGGREREALRAVEPAAAAVDGLGLRALARAGDVSAAERALATAAQAGPGAAYEALQPVVRDEVDVHQVVLAWRVWDTLQLVGEQHATTLLRQSLRHSMARQRARAERDAPEPGVRALLPELLEELRHTQLGARSPTDAELELLALVLVRCEREEGARQMAAALKQGLEPLALGEALSLAASHLLLCDPGRARADEGKPLGSVHGASVGVHASDAARAWRNIARAVGPAQRAATLIAGAYHTGGQGQQVGADEFPWRAALPELEGAGARDGRVEHLTEALRSGDQVRAVAAVELADRAGVPTERLLAVLLHHGTQADGALHAEKYFLTVVEELAEARPAFRSRHLRGLARVTASEQGFPAPGLEQARDLLGA